MIAPPPLVRPALRAAGDAAALAWAMAFPASLWLNLPQLLWTCGLGSLVTAAAAFGIFLGRGRGTGGVLAGFVGGFLLKLLGIIALYFVLRAAGEPTTGPLVLLLIIYLAAYVWTSWRFHVLSAERA